MDFILTKDSSTKGSWYLITGCPLPEKHDLRDDPSKTTGPTFAVCAACEHQVGMNFQIFGEDSDGANQVYPERLKCGAPKLRLVK